VVTGPRIINKAVRAEMKKVLKEIQDGTFARGWIREAKTGKKKYHKLLADGTKHPIEKVGARLRGLMPWIGKRNLGGAQASY
jgi:ketol-acid reductoisomerase